MALKKMKLVAFDKKGEKKIGRYVVLINPDTYTHTYNIKYHDATGQGMNGTLTEFDHIGEETVSFKITFDGTGVVPESPPEGGSVSVKKQIEDFRNLVFEFEGKIHRPNIVMLKWGTLRFKCQLRTMNVKYVLFTPEGEPVRAESDVTFAGYNTAKELKKEGKPSSPDMSHLVTVQAGDTVPLLCYRIYGTSLPYAQVARINGLTAFRRIEPGTELLFPPLRRSPG